MSSFSLQWVNHTPDRWTAYCIYPKYWDTLSSYHTYSKIWKSLFYYLLIVLKYCCMYGKQCWPWTECSILSGSILFAKAYLSQYIQLLAGLGGSVGCASDWRPGGRWFDPRQGRQHSFVEIGHEIFSTVILSLLLIQEGQLSDSGERMCTILVNCLEEKPAQ